MSNSITRLTLAFAAAAGIALSPAAISHFDDTEMPQSYRQSYFTLVAMNFGPVVATVKGEIPWNQDKMEDWTNDLAALSTLDVMRGFVDGSEQGTTRAKPEIWDNKADFESKLNDLNEALSALQLATAGGDKKAIAEKVGAAGKTCKSCHDDYKAENYLY